MYQMLQSLYSGQVSNPDTQVVVRMQCGRGLGASPAALQQLGDKINGVDDMGSSTQKCNLLTRRVVAANC